MNKNKWQGKGKALPLNRMPANTCRRNDGIRKRSFDNHYHNYFRYTYQWILGRTGYLYSFKVSLNDFHINYKGGKYTFTKEKLGRHHCNQMIKVNINDGTSGNCVPLMDAMRIRYHFYQ